MSNFDDAIEQATECAEKAKAICKKPHAGAVQLAEAQVWATLALHYSTAAAMYDARRGAGEGRTS